MKHVTALLVVAALLGGCSKTASTGTGQANGANAGSESATAAPVVSNDGSSGTSSTLPVYPRATKDPGKSSTIRDGGKSTAVVYYDTQDDGPTVAAWYQAHLPSGWSDDMGAPGKKIAGVFTSPDQSQNVMVTGGPSGTEIVVSADVASK